MNKIFWSFSLCWIVLSSNAFAQTNNDAVPAEIASLLDRQLKTWEVLSPAKVNIIRGDFDGDQQQDTAILLKEAASNPLSPLHCGTRPIQYHPEYSIPQNIKLVFIWGKHNKVEKIDVPQHKGFVVLSKISWYTKLGNDMTDSVEYLNYSNGTRYTYDYSDGKFEKSVSISQRVWSARQKMDKAIRKAKRYWHRNAS